MSIVKVTLPGGQIPVNGKQVSFIAPCDCTNVEGLSIEGEVYTVVDAMGQCVTGIGGAFCAGSVVSVILNVDEKKAFIQNPSTTNLYLHWWKRRTEESGYDFVVSKTATTFYPTMVNGQSQIFYSDTISLTEDNYITLDNYSTMSFLNNSDLSSLAGKYIYANANAPSQNVFTKVYKCGQNVARVGSATSGLGISDVYEITVEWVDSYGEWEYVSSANRNAYPDSGTLNGLTYYYLGKPFDNARGMNFAITEAFEQCAKIVTGSYVGTGTYGASNPCSLTFEVEPKIILMLGYISTSGGFTPMMRNRYVQSNFADEYMVYMPCVTTDYTAHKGFGYNAKPSSSYAVWGKKSADGKTFSWYNTLDAAAMCNVSGYTYHYMAIC